MSPLRPTLLILISLSFSLPVTAQPPPRDPQAITVLTQALAVMGPRVVEVQDSVADGTILLPDGRSGAVTLKTKRPLRLRHELSLPLGQRVIIVNGRRGHLMEGGQRRRLPLWAVLYQRPMHVPALSRLADYLEANTNVRYLGVEQVAGRSAHHIRLSNLPTDQTPVEIEELVSEFHVYVDAQTSLLLKTVNFEFSPQIIENRSRVETLYSDYRAVGGLLVVPHRISRFVGGQRDIEITLTSKKRQRATPQVAAPC